MQLYRAHAAALAIACAAFVLLLCVAYGVFDGYPFCMDEYGYWYQAEMFARGKTHLGVPSPDLEPLKEAYVIWHDGAVFSKYPPGFSLVLSLGALVGAPAAINPLIGAISSLLLYVAGFRLVGRRYALVAQLVLVTNPYFVAYSASYYAHSLTLLLSLVIVVILTDPTPARSRRWIVLGCVLGAFTWVRPLDALCAGLFVAYAVVKASGWRAAFRAAAWAIGPFVAFVLALMLYNLALSGRFALSAYPVLDAEFQLVAGDDLGFWDNVAGVANDYLHRLVVHAKVLWWHHFLWPTAVVVPTFALLAMVLRAGERRWRLALGFYFVALVLLYNFHAMEIRPVPTWPQYGMRYWYAGFGALVLLAIMTATDLAARVRASRVAALATPRVGWAIVAVVLAVQLAVGIAVFRDYNYRFAVVAAIRRDIEQRCPGKRIVGLEPSARPPLPAFVNGRDFRRNPFFDGERLFVFGAPSERVLRALPGYTVCRYDFRTWGPEI